VFLQGFRIMVLGGPTGTGKTDLLKAMQRLGTQVLDLEHFANHKGSAFGGLGMDPQPTSEMFGNLLAMALSEVDAGKDLWIENESRSIGACILPPPIYEAIRTSHVIELEIPFQERMERITREYGGFPVQELRDATNKVKKRMGPQHAKEAIAHLESGDFASWLHQMLSYYDRLYQFGSTQREPSSRHSLTLSSGNADERARQVLEYVHQLNMNSKPIST
jgi:tRNA 2-selenouridine synthase